MSHRSNRTIALTSLGCKVNQADADEWVRELVDLGYDIVPFDEVADAYVVNTCSVTHVADRKSRQLLRQARRLNPAALVVATGCYASVAAEEIARIAGIDMILGRDDKPKLARLIHSALEGDSEQPRETTSANRRDFVGRTRAFVKIADGCDKFCAFCIVPFARGRARSIAADEAVARVAALTSAGFREIVLTAVHMGTYGRDLAPRVSLRQLTERVLRETPIERLRLSSVEPEDFDRDLLGLFAEYPGRLCRHVHLALDSGADATLARMRRRYTAAEYVDLVAAIRAAVPGVAITTDILVGFPGETDAENAESYRFVEEMGFAQTHVFKYSPRRRTVAARLPDQVADAAKQERLDAMLGLAESSARRFREGLVGQTLSVLFEAEVTGDPPGGRLPGGERPGEGQAIWSGLTDNYARVFAPSRRPLTNQLLATRILGLHAEGLTGEVVEGTDSDQSAAG